jgi:predicted PhzF superfamily epimerase YddE/YHI9
MKLSYFQVDAFSSEPFHGNPAGVCLLERWLSDSTLQNVAAENNLSETAFLVRRGGNVDFDLRWFTPATEVDLCGHATLASAFVLFAELGESGNEIRFSSRSGILKVARENELLVLDFPARPATPCRPPEPLLRGLGKAPSETRKARDYLAVFASAAEVLALRPDFTALATLDCLGIIATAPGEDCDFVSRFFAPGAGIPEDPVTGSAHCTLIPYWSQRLGRERLFARQVSSRGGELFCRQAGERVFIGGKAVLYSKGHIEIADAAGRAQ